MSLSTDPVELLSADLRYGSMRKAAGTKLGLEEALRGLYACEEIIRVGTPIWFYHDYAEWCGGGTWREMFLQNGYKLTSLYCLQSLRHA